MIDFNPKPRDYQVLFLDMNCYFASVEQQVQPTLREVPVGVAPYTGGTGCIIACSRQAKEWGVRAGGLVSEAKEICPKIKIIEARPELYQFYHREILKILKLNSPLVTPLSIDEFMIHLSGSDCNLQRSKRIALKIKSDLRNMADYLTCSMGIGPNYFLAKVAGESKKPDGLTIIRLNDLDNFYKNLKLRDIPGINRRMERQLALRRVYTSYQFYKKSLIEMVKMLKHPGKVWYYRLRGYGVDQFEIKNKTCGHSYVLPPHFRTKKGALSVLEKLAFKTASRLRRENLWVRGVYVAVGFLESGGFGLGKGCDLFNDTATLIKNLKLLTSECKIWKTPIYVSVTCFNLVGTTYRQISILSEIEKSNRVSRAMDKVNDQFGANSIISASAFQAKDSAPDRIPFGRPRYNIRHF